MKLKFFQVDAFSASTLNGNPAAVCPLEAWLPDDTLRAIAAENNLAETAYFVGNGADYELRWFTPEVEVDLCGHATLAASWVLFNELSLNEGQIRFNTRSGELRVTRDGDWLSMDLPARPPQVRKPPEDLLAALGLQNALEVLESRDYVVVVDSEELVQNVSPDFRALKECTKLGVSVTAPGRDFDFVSRWFGPRIGIDEDIVTGAAHTSLAPYWSNRLNKTILTARQGNRRFGELRCEIAGDRVILSGRATTYLIGEIFV
jgi:phenazine biosynthesis protein PhzF family